MAATNGTTTHLTAGPTVSSAPITAEEAQEYERILKISEEIFSGSHPRLKVPQKFVRKPKPQSGQASPLPQQVTKKKPAGTEPTAQLETSRDINSTQISPVEYAPSPISTNTAPAARVTSKHTSGIDPIFLTKSDDLVRAEIQLQRQRVERTLRDQLEQRKQEVKQKPNIQDIKPDFDVSDVLNKAFEIVKPVSLSDPSEINGTDSFDENSYYSSKAPDSPPPVGEHQNLSPVIPTGPAGASRGPPVEHYADELQRLEALNRTGSDQEMQDAYQVADQRNSHPQTQLQSSQTQAARRFHEAQEADIVDEPEYSPPAPVAPPLDHRTYEPVPVNNQGRPRYAERPPDVPYYSPGNNVTVVRNHITSPAAPRPSRVSPLATSKVAPIQQVRDDRYEPALSRIESDPDSGRASPNAPASQIVSRKRRRLQERGQNVQVSSKRQNADHSDTYIKEEPVSPPPFTDDHTTVRNQQARQHPVYIDIESPRYTPVLERRELPPRAPIYEIDPYGDIPNGQVPTRTMSRVETKRPAREETDLRRVASLQYARQPEYPHEYIEHDLHAGRSASFNVIGRRQPEQPRYYEDVSYEPRYIQVHEPSQPAYAGEYYEEPQLARAMPPPQRRYVVDEHGNEYEIVPSRRTQTMAPPPRPASRVPGPQAEIYNDRPPARTASVRAPSVVQDPYVERRYVQEMPPPQPLYRRVASDYARPATGERQTYLAPLETHEPYSRAGSVQVADYIPRRPAYVEEQALPRERVIRTSSVRPQPQHRYEAPHEVVQRVGSTRPAGPGREVSGYLDERSMGDYVERPYFVRERRYFDDENHIALDGNTEQPVHRVSQHY